MRRATSLLVALFLPSFSLRAQPPSAATDPSPATSESPAAAKGEGDDDSNRSPEVLAELVDTAVHKLAEQRKAAAFKRFKAKDYPAALKGFQEALGLDPGDAETANNVGYIHELLGNREQAELFYRKAIALDPERAVAFLNLADLLSREQSSEKRLAEAAEMLTRARELQGNQPEVIIRQARVAAQRGRFEEAQRFYRKYLTLGEPDDALRLELGDFYRNRGQTDEAMSWYRQITQPGELTRQAAQRIFEMEVDRQARRFGFQPRRETIPPRARALASKGRILFGQGRYAEAESILNEAIRIAPEFALARANLGDVLRETGRRSEAELSFLRALAIAGDDAEIHVRLAELYLSDQQTDRTAEGVLFLERALAQRPDWTELHLKLARAHRTAGDLPRALFHVNRYLAEVESETDRTSAIALKAALVPLLGPGDDGKTLSPGTDSVPAMDEELIKTLSRARAHLERGATDAALAELRRLAREERGAEVLNLEARILYAAGRLDEAAAVWRRSLKRSPDQEAVHAQLGILLMEQGKHRRARRHLLKAEALGDTSGTYQLARLDAGADRGLLSLLLDIPRLSRLTDVGRRLDRYLESGAVSVHRREAEALRARVRTRLIGSAVTLASGFLFLLVGGVLVFWRVWGGTDLPTLLALHPETGPDVQRVLSALRHEVLKHNTMVLQGLAESLAHGGDVSDKASHCKRSLFGEGEEQGAVHKLTEYADQLRQIARAHGVRLNIERKDRALSALLLGFRELKKVAHLMEKADSVGPFGRARLLRGVRSAARLLNAEGYQAIRELLDRIRVFQVSRESVRNIFERVRREPAFADFDVARLRIDDQAHLPCAVLIPQSAFEDIVANLMRNALQSSLRSRYSQEDLTAKNNGEGIEVGFGVQTQVDTVTGLERVTFLIRDRSQEQLTDEMLRGRYIEEGLGLTADLVSRYDGSLSVVSEQPGWTKAVALTLPRAYPEQ